jgi:hypothetical protein
VEAIGQKPELVSLWNVREDPSGPRKLLAAVSGLESSTDETYFISAEFLPYRLKLWGEAQQTANPDPDIGITSDLPLIKEAIAPLFFETALVRPDDDTVFGMVEKETQPYMRIV